MNICLFGELQGVRSVISGIVLPTKKKFFVDTKYYVWEEPFPHKIYEDGIHRRCLPEDEICSVLHHYYASTYGGHYGPDKMIAKPSKLLLAYAL